MNTIQYFVNHMMAPEVLFELLLNALRQGLLKDEITKISIDMTDQIMDETYKKFVLEFEFMNFGKTNLEIPKEAKESTMNIENYMTTYSLYQEIEENTLST